MNYEYLVAGISIVNDIYPTAQKPTRNILGGCCLFAYSGIRLFTSSVLPITSGGEDFYPLYGEYFKRNHVPTDGVYITMPHTHHTQLTYKETGEWTEESIYGPSYFEDQSTNNGTSFSKLDPFLSQSTKGLYLDSNPTENIFNEIDQIRKKAPHIKIMWEPTTFSFTNPDLFPFVYDNIRKVDYFSMNLPEAQSFFSTLSREEIIERIQSMEIPCFLREGIDGATWIEDLTVAHLPAYRPSIAVDPTGCGNCSTAVAMYAKCEGNTPLQIVATANTAAAVCAQFQGPIELTASEFNLTTIMAEIQSASSLS